MKRVLFIWAQYLVLIEDTQELTEPEFQAAMTPPVMTDNDALPLTDHSKGLAPLAESPADVYTLAGVGAEVLLAHRFTQANLPRQVTQSTMHMVDAEESMAEAMKKGTKKGGKKDDFDQERIAQLAKLSKFKGLEELYIDKMERLWVRLAQMFISIQITLL